MTRIIVIALAVAAHLHAADNYLLRTYLFRGTSSPQRQALERGIILDRTTHPDFFSSLDLMSFREEDASVLLAEALMNSLEYQSVEVFQMFAGKISHSGRILRDRFVVKPGWAFNLEIKPQPVSGKGFRFQATLNGVDTASSGKAKTQSSEKILDAAYRTLEASGARRTMPLLLGRDFVIKPAEPVFCLIPYQEGISFILAFFLEEIKAEKQGDASPKGKVLETKGVQSLREVLPHYPFDLREKGIEGTVKLRVGVDPAGNLVGIQILKTLHPFLDQSSLRAVKQWTFSPALEEGKAVYGQLDIEFRFDRQAWLRLEAERPTVPAGDAPGPSGTIGRILQLGAAYSQKLAAAAYDFVCEETIKETVYPTWMDRLAAAGTPREIVQDMGIQKMMGDAYHVMQGVSRGAANSPTYLKKREYRSDFQFVRKNGELSARRLPSPERPGNSGRPEDARYAAFKPFSMIGELLSPARQHLFYYLLRDEDAIKGRKAWVVDILPKSGVEFGIESARVWLEKETGRVIKAETEGAFLEGFEAVTAETTRFALQPEFRTSYTFQVENSGFIFPDQIHLQVYYPPLQAMAKKNRKIELLITYDKYKFFKVETVEKIKASEGSDQK